MKITTTADADAGTLQITLDVPVQADPDRTADLAWAAVERALVAAQRARGTVPDGLR